MAKRVRFGMCWLEYGQEDIPLPSNIDPNDGKAITEFLKSMWGTISIPEGEYVPGSDYLDEDSPFEVYDDGLY